MTDMFPHMLVIWHFQSFSRTKDMTWRPDLFSDSMAASGIETGTKLYISNLDYRVSNEDIKVGEASRQPEFTSPRLLYINYYTNLFLICLSGAVFRSWSFETLCCSL